MATSGYIGEIQPAAQSQGPGITVTPGQPDASSTPATAPQFLAEIQTAVATPTVVTATGQTTPTEQETSIATQKPAASSQAQSTAQAQSSQTQYVTAEIQGSPTQSGNAQCTPQYIVVTVTEGSLHSSDSVSDSSPPPAVVQTGVPTHVVQQVQTAQQRSVVQATSQIAKTEPGTQLSVTSLQPVHISAELLPTTAVTALVRDESPEVLLVCAIGQPECLAWALADDIRDCGGELLYLPIDLLLYYQSLIKKETGAPPSAAS